MVVSCDVSGPARVPLSSYRDLGQRKVQQKSQESKARGKRYLSSIVARLYAFYTAFRSVPFKNLFLGAVIQSISSNKNK